MPGVTTRARSRGVGTSGAEHESEVNPDLQAPPLSCAGEPAPALSATAVVAAASAEVPPRRGEGFVLRPASVADLADVERVERDCFPERGYSSSVLRQFFDLHGELLFVVESSCTCGSVGYALGGLSSLQPGSAWILSVAVSSPWRRRGAGRMLMLKLLGTLSELSVTSVRLTVHPVNSAALAFYASLGFVAVHEESDYFGVDEPRVVLELRRDGHEPFGTAAAIPQ